MAERSMRLRLGAFVAAALTGLAGLAVLFGGRPGLFTTRATYVVTFPEAPGIAPGTPVRKSGVRIGEVVSLDLDENTSLVRVNVQLDPAHRPRVGEEPVITRGILSGDTSLDFVPKVDEDNKPMEHGDPYTNNATIAGISPVNTRTLLSQAAGALPTAQQSLLKLTETMERAVPKLEKAADGITALSRSSREFVPELRQTNLKVQELLGADVPDPANPNAPPATIRQLLAELVVLMRTVRPVAEDVSQLVKQNGPELTKSLQSFRAAADNIADVTNPENRKNVASTLKNLNTASDDIVKTIRLVALLLDQAETTFKSLNARLAQAEKAFTNFEKITKPAADNAEQIVADVAESAKNIRAASADLSKTLTEVQGLLKSVNNSQGTVGKALTDPSLFNNLNEASVALTRTLLRAERIARDLEVFADKVARKPETIGLGGVVKPSTGLKESPTAPLPPSPVLPPLPSTQSGQPVPIEPPSVVPFPPTPAFRPSDRPPPP